MFCFTQLIRLVISYNTGTGYLGIYVIMFYRTVLKNAPMDYTLSNCLELPLPHQGIKIRGGNQFNQILIVSYVSTYVTFFKEL